MSRRRTLTLWLAGTALALTGCGGDDPAPEFEADTAPTVTASATPVAEKETPEEFIRRWVEVEHQMFTSGRTAEYRTMTSACSPCSELADRVERYYADGGFIRGGKGELKSVERTKDRTYEVVIHSAPSSYKVSAKSPRERVDGGEAKYELLVRRVDGGLELEDFWARPL